MDSLGMNWACCQCYLVVLLFLYFLCFSLLYLCVGRSEECSENIVCSLESVDRDFAWSLWRNDTLFRIVFSLLIDDSYSVCLMHRKNWDCSMMHRAVRGNGFLFWNHCNGVSRG